MIEIGARTALVVVDVQNGFVNDKSRTAIPGIQRLLVAWKAGNGPIFFTKFTNTPGSKWETLINWRRLREAPETDLHKDVKPFVEGSHILTKDNLYSSIVGNLADAIAEGEVDAVYICGIATESCVLATALAVFEDPQQVTPVVVQDACASHAGMEAHNAGLLVISRFIGPKQVVAVDDVVGQ